MIVPIPAIDIIGGRCVRLAQGDYSKATSYSGSPLQAARLFESLGYGFLHVVDLDGAKRGEPVNIDVLRTITENTGLRVDFGGGIKSEAHLEQVFGAGAEAVSIGSMAVGAFDTVSRWIEHWGADRFILSADVLDGKVRTHGWTEDSGVTLYGLLDRYWPLGVRRVLCTDISRDGMLCGPNIQLYREIMQRYPDCRLVASGGVACMEDIEALDAAGIPAVVFGRAIYEGKIDMRQLAERFIINKDLKGGARNNNK